MWHNFKTIPYNQFFSSLNDQNIFSDRWRWWKKFVHSVFGCFLNHQIFERVKKLVHAVENRKCKVQKTIWTKAEIIGEPLFVFFFLFSLCWPSSFEEFNEMKLLGLKIENSYERVQYWFFIMNSFGYAFFCVPWEAEWKEVFPNSCYVAFPQFYPIFSHDPRAEKRP